MPIGEHSEDQADQRRIAFLILAHSDPQHLQRLVDRLQPHAVFVHWDLKSKPIRCPVGATLIRPSISVYWAGFSQVQATIELIREALRSGEKFTKIVLLSGACYPIKKIEELNQYFKYDKDHNYLKSVCVEDSEHLKMLVKKIKWRDGIFPHKYTRGKVGNFTERAVRKIIEAIVSLFPKRRPRGLELYHGSNWWALSQECCRYILDLFEKRMDIKRFYRLTFSSDEQIFHTIVMNSEFRKDTDPVMLYRKRGTYQAANLHFIDPSLQKWFDERDFFMLRDSQKFFVRKVKTGISNKLLDMIDNKLL